MDSSLLRHVFTFTLLPSCVSRFPCSLYTFTNPTNQPVSNTLRKNKVLSNIPIIVISQAISASSCNEPPDACKENLASRLQHAHAEPLRAIESVYRPPDQYTKGPIFNHTDKNLTRDVLIRTRDISKTIHSSHLPLPSILAPLTSIQQRQQRQIEFSGRKKISPGPPESLLSGLHTSNPSLGSFADGCHGTPIRTSHRSNPWTSF